jgi:hypothetical protein
MMFVMIMKAFNLQELDIGVFTVITAAGPSPSPFIAETLTSYREFVDR